MLLEQQAYKGQIERSAPSSKLGSRIFGRAEDGWKLLSSEESPSVIESLECVTQSEHFSGSFGSRVTGRSSKRSGNLSSNLSRLCNCR